jgi:DeoR/GlpR family transcriptional regulator of sugar metabolism
MSVWERHDLICNLLASNTQLNITEIAKKLNTSEVTIRKDLNSLQEKGLVERAHGIARIVPNVRAHYSLEKEMKVNFYLVSVYKAREHAGTRGADSMRNRLTQRPKL